MVDQEWALQDDLPLLHKCQVGAEDLRGAVIVVLYGEAVAADGKGKGLRRLSAPELHGAYGIPLRDFDVAPDLENGAGKTAGDQKKNAQVDDEDPEAGKGP